MIAIPEKPRIEPIDRSNSPAIISSATATARIPRGAARLRIEAVVAIPMKLLSAAMIAKKTQTTTSPAIAPSSGRPRSLESAPTRRTRSSAAGGGARLPSLPSLVSPRSSASLKRPR